MESFKFMGLKRFLFLIAVAAELGGCRSHERFSHVDSQNPFVMFDQKTAQSCWAGPASEPPSVSTGVSGEINEDEVTPDEAVAFGLKVPGDPKTANPPH